MGDQIVYAIFTPGAKGAGRHFNHPEVLGTPSNFSDLNFYAQEVFVFRWDRCLKQMPYFNKDLEQDKMKWCSASASVTEFCN